MKISRISKQATSSKSRNKLLAAIFSCVASYSCLLFSHGADGQTSTKSDRQRIFSTLQLDKAVFLSAMRLPINLPEQPVRPESLSASTNLSLASSSILPLLSAPSDLYDLLKSNQLVQIIADVELGDTKSDVGQESNSKGLTRNLVVTLKKDSPQLVQLDKNSSKQKSGHKHGVESSPMEWQGEGSYWYATALDAKHLLVSNKRDNTGKVKSRFAFSSAFNDLPNRMKLLLTDATGEPDLWQILDTSIVDESNADRASSQLCEFAQDKTSMVSFVEPGTEVLKTIVSSTNKSVADKLKRELNDFKEPAEFDLKKIADSKFTITISGVEPKSTKAKVFLLLLTGPLSAS